MKCAKCGIEMSIDSSVQQDNTVTYVYKCRNPKCKAYGYKKSTKQADAPDTAKSAEESKVG